MCYVPALEKESIMEQRQYRMPATGEGWRHFKGELYTVIGIGRDSANEVVVVYTDYGWGLIQLPPLHVRKVGEFLQQCSFSHERGGDEKCPFIHPVTGTGFRKYSPADDGCTDQATQPPNV